MWGDFAVASPNCIEAGVASGSLCQSLRRNPKTTCTKRPPLEDGSTNNFHWVDNGSWWVAISWLTSPPSFSKRIHATVCQQQYCCTRILLTHLSKEGYKHHKHTTTPQQKTQKKKTNVKKQRVNFLKAIFYHPWKIRQDCLLRWLRCGRRCPLCRMDLHRAFLDTGGTGDLTPRAVSCGVWSQPPLSVSVMGWNLPKIMKTVGKNQE